jgi:hypothetical protein
MSAETEKQEFKRKVTVTLKIPEPVFHFYRAVAESKDMKLEDYLVEELIENIEARLDSGNVGELTAIITKSFGLEKFLKMKT